MTDSSLKQVFQSKSTVLTPQELAAIWDISNYNYLKTKIQYYIKKGHLHRIAHGLYAKNEKDFNVLEAANKLRSPSYISLETVLASEGIIFQKYSSIFLVSYASKTVQTSAGEFVYKKIKDDILFSNQGIINTGTYCIASKERAFLDAVYLYKNYFFDNLRPIDWTIIFDLLPIYNSKVMIKRIGEYKNA